MLTAHLSEATRQQVAAAKGDTEQALDGRLKSLRFEFHEH
eukprot:gene52945-40913_t